MPPRALEDCELWTTLENGNFFTISEEVLLRQICAAFRPETERLKGAFAVERNTPPRIVLNGTILPPTPSQVLFDEDYDEVNRTYLGILALRWLINDDYERFTRGQIEEIKLTRHSFDWLRDYFKENLPTSMDLFALVLAMVVNDLGKDPALVDDYHEKEGKALHGSNHDLILLEAARSDMVSCLDYLDEAHRADVMLGLELGSELNAGQLAQAENVPVNLEGLLVMRDHERAFNLKFMEQILDVAGAAGHIYSDGIKNMIEPVFQAFKTVHEVSLCIIRKECSLRQGYDQVLTKRGKLLEEQGFRPLSVKVAEERALLRLLTMGRAASLKQATLFDQAFNALKDHKQLLVEGLNIDAIEANETAVIPYYMPAMIAETLRSTRDHGNEQDALTSLFRYLARVLLWTDDAPIPKLKEGQAATWPMTLPRLHIPPVMPSPLLIQHKEGRVFERNMTKARETISSPQFRDNPSVLDDLDPPEGYLLQRRRTSQSV